MESLNSLLVADPDPSMMDSFRRLGYYAPLRLPHSVTTGKEAQLAIADQSHFYSAIFISENLRNPDGISVIRFSKQRRPSTPIFLIQSEDQSEKLDYWKIRSLGVRGSMSRKIATEAILKLMAPQPKKQSTLDDRLSELLTQTTEFTRSLGASMTKEALLESCQYLRHLKIYGRMFSSQSEVLLRYMLNSQDELAHGAMTGLITYLLMRPLHMDSNHAMKMAMFTGLFHDIGAHNQSKAKDVHETHPTRGAQIIKNVQGTPAVIVQAIAQHHERKDRSGFPNHLPGGSINRLAEIVGLSDEFVTRFCKETHGSPIDVIQQMEKEIFSGFTTPVLEAFKGIFSLKRTNH